MIEQLKQIVKSTLTRDFRIIRVDSAYEVTKIYSFTGYYFKLYRVGVTLLEAYVEDNVIYIQFVDYELYTEEIEAIKWVAKEHGYTICADKFQQFA